MATPTAQLEKQSGIAQFAQPYVESMLGATMQNLFNVDPATGQLTGLREYTPYSYRPEDYVAAMTPLQQQAMQGLAGLQASPYTAQGADAAARAIARAEGMQYTPIQQAIQNVAAPSLQNFQMQAPANVVAPTAQAATLGAAPTAQAVQTQAATLGAAPQTQAALAQAARLGAAPTIGAAQFQGPGAVGFERVSSRDITAPEMQAAQTNYRPDLQYFQMGPAERIGEPGSITARGALDAYMSPYMQNVVDVQQREAKRQAAIAQQALGAQAARAGAFGGSGASLQRAQANAQLQRDLQGIQALGSQKAYETAQQQFNAEQQARMQAAQANQQAGLTVGAQNLAAKLGVQQLGTQTGLQTALANLSAQQQAAVQNQAAKLQAAGMNQQQALQAALANQQAGMQTGQFNAAQQFNTALQNAQLQQQAAMANQAQAGQFGLAQGQLDQAANLANQQAQNQIGLANQALAGQYGLTQGQFSQAANLANQQAAQQTALANQALAGQYGLTQGQFGQAANLQNAQTGLQALLANQQAGLTTGQQNLQANLATQQLGAGQNLQAQLANQQAQQAANALAAQQQQFGANLGLQAGQQALSGANILGNLGTTSLQNQVSILGAQNQAGAQQQALNQKAIDTAVQNYNTAQQYPYMQLGFMQNMLGSLPIGTTSEQKYEAAPSLASQLIGVGTALAGASGGTQNNLLGGLGGLLNQGASGVGSLISGGANLLGQAATGVGNFLGGVLGGAEGGLPQDFKRMPNNNAPAGVQAIALSKI